MTVTLDMVPGLIATGASARLADDVKPVFKPGDRITVKSLNPFGHTRLPRYVRGKTGVVERVHGVFVYPDTAAHGRGHKPQNVYSVRFEMQELWGDDAPVPSDVLYIDLWDDYIEPAS